MIGGKKVIGVCMTKIHDTPRSRTIAYLKEEADKRDMKIIVFNSAFDFYHDVEDDLGAAQIYDYINYDYIDVLIILCSGFLDKSVYKRIVANAKAHNTPVILEDDSDEYCYTVQNSYEDTLEKLISHIIVDHGIRDPFFVAGIPDNEFSAKRENIYKKVLADNGIPFDDSMMGYGYFWDQPTYELLDKRFPTVESLPGAFICANDAMGIAVCKRMEQMGVRVPEDVIVTGFDGSKLADFASPRLSSCIADHLGFVKECISLVNDILDGNTTEKIRTCHYSLRLSESCGCNQDISDVDLRKEAEENYKLVLDVFGHEHLVFNKIANHLNSGSMDMSSFYAAIKNLLNDNSCLALKPSFILSVTSQDRAYDGNFEDEELMIIAGNTSTNTGKRISLFKTADMMPYKELWADTDMICVVDSVQVGATTCGYMLHFTDNIIRDAHVINRIHNNANMLIHIAVADMRARFMKIDSSKDALINTVTELPNLHSATYWFNDFVNNPANANTCIAVSVYEIPKYTYIFENYGTQEIEGILCFIAEALKIANSGGGYIAQTSEDQFVVIDSSDDMETIKNNVAHAALLFFSILENYNITNSKDYNLEILSGCGAANTAKAQRLEGLMSKAMADMIVNKNKYNAGNTTVKKPVTTSKDQYKLLNVLLDKNLFKYHFQPIVRADNGEIYGYEALMRTDESIGFNPLEVLAIARDYNRLYDIEKATIFNVMERYVADIDVFEGKKVFINCIPGHFLNDEDNATVSKAYSQYIPNFVFEITEQDTITDSELDEVRRIGNPEGNNAIAVDDYGAGHSNIINLIKYKPEIVKIDRFLMTDIHKDESKQMVVRGVIDFARLNNIKVLAEGIETEEELRKVIEMGVDFIQGYYTGRPSFEPVMTINGEVKQILLDAAANYSLQK